MWMGFEAYKLAPLPVHSLLPKYRYGEYGQTKQLLPYSNKQMYPSRTQAKNKSFPLSWYNHDFIYSNWKSNKDAPLHPLETISFCIISASQQVTM